MSLIRGNRDLRIDFFRGLALWWIFTDHIPGNVLGAYSLRNFALCDATEVFVLLAGFGAGLAYGSTMDRCGYAYAAVDVLRRAWVLFIAHILLFVVYAALVGYAANSLGHTGYLDESHLDVLAGAPYRALLEALVLRYQPSLLNILPLYVVLLLIFAIALPLLRRPKLLLILSLVLYLIVRAAGINFPSWIGGGWFFNPLTWQFLFVIGAVLAYAPIRMPEQRRLFDAAAVFILLIGLVIICVIWGHPSLAGMLPEPVAHAVLSIDKTNLDPFRLSSILSLLWLTVRLVPRGTSWLRWRFVAPLVLIGQHSLPVFCFGVVMGFAGRLCLEAHDGSLIQVLVNVVGAGSLVAVGALAAWYSQRGTGMQPKPAITSRGTKMLGGMPVRRIIAAADVTAGPADAQVNQGDPIFKDSSQPRALGVTSRMPSRCVQVFFMSGPHSGRYLGAARYDAVNAHVRSITLSLCEPILHRFAGGLAPPYPASE